jgi:sterol desaturase/sphingolipid hydroxylase (fatty acid hydroxylase superfamily)
LVTVMVAASGPAMSRLGPESLRRALGQWPWPARLALIVVVTDLANYLIHRLLHRAPVLWAFHAVHHSSSRLDWLATARGHPIDQAINISVIALPTYALGAARWAPWLIAFLFLYPFLLHADIRLRLPYVDLVFVTPAFHRWHHGADIDAHDRNFGAILSVWDRLFGTFIASDSRPERYGLDDGTLAASDYVGQLISPLSTAAAALRHRGRTEAWSGLMPGSDISGA